MSSRSNDADTAGPWVDLLPELCDLVLDRVDAIGVVCFPAVCANWAAAASKNTHRPRLPSGMPMLLTSSLDAEGCEVEYDVDPGAFGLHDVATGEAEGLKKRTWIGGNDDWLVTMDMRCSVDLFNPITGARVPLPSFETILGIKVLEVRDRGPRVCFEKSLHGFVLFRSLTHCFQKVTVCQTPAHPSGYLVVSLFSDNASLVAFTAAGDERWTPLNSPKGLKYTDVTVHKGKAVAVARCGRICSWDMDGGIAVEPVILRPPVIVFEHYTRRKYYLATSSDGNLQVVCLFNDYEEDTKDDRWWRIVFDFEWSFWPRRVLLHELDAVTGAWRRVGNLGGGRALFVGANYPFYIDVPRDGSKDPLIREDCVYVTDLNSYDAGIFDLKLGDDFEFNSNAYLSYPAMSDALQMPMWFRRTAALPKSQVPIE